MAAFFCVRKIRPGLRRRWPDLTPRFGCRRLFVFMGRSPHNYFSFCANSSAALRNSQPTDRSSFLAILLSFAKVFSSIQIVNRLMAVILRCLALCVKEKYYLCMNSEALAELQNSPSFFSWTPETQTIRAAKGYNFRARSSIHLSGGDVHQSHCR